MDESANGRQSIPCDGAFVAACPNAMLLMSAQPGAARQGAATDGQERRCPLPRIRRKHNAS